MDAVLPVPSIEVDKITFYKYVGCHDIKTHCRTADYATEFRFWYGTPVGVIFKDKLTLHPRKYMLSSTFRYLIDQGEPDVLEWCILLAPGVSQRERRYALRNIARRRRHDEVVK